MKMYVSVFTGEEDSRREEKGTRMRAVMTEVNRKSNAAGKFNFLIFDVCLEKPTTPQTTRLSGY